jgi:hypothetical protein
MFLFNQVSVPLRLLCSFFIEARTVKNSYFQQNAYDESHWFLASNRFFGQQGSNAWIYVIFTGEL